MVDRFKLMLLHKRKYYLKKKLNCKNKSIHITFYKDSFLRKIFDFIFNPKQHLAFFWKLIGKFSISLSLIKKIIYFRPESL